MLHGGDPVCQERWQRALLRLLLGCKIAFTKAPIRNSGRQVIGALVLGARQRWFSEPTESAV